MVVRDAKYNSERRLAQEAKNNPKVFFTHIYRMGKAFIMEEVTQLQRMDGTLTITNKEACELLIQEFHRIYQQEDNIPETTYYSGVDPSAPNWHQKCSALGVNCITDRHYFN